MDSSLCGMMLGFMLVYIGCSLSSGVDIYMAALCLLSAVGFCVVIFSLWLQGRVGPGRSRAVLMMGAWALLWGCYLVDTALFSWLLGLGFGLVGYGLVIRPELRER